MVVAELDLASASRWGEHSGRGLVGQEVTHVLLSAGPRVVVCKAAMTNVGGRGACMEQNGWAQGTHLAVFCLVKRLIRHAAFGYTHT